MDSPQEMNIERGGIDSGWMKPMLYPMKLYATL